MNRPEKAGKLIDYLEERLVSGQYAVGSKIPSVRRLADKFEISYGTALRGVDYLCDRGKFEKIPNRGIFVCKRPVTNGSGKIKRIAVFMESYVTEVHCGMCYTAFLGMQELARKAGYTFMVNPLMVEDATPEIMAEMSKGAEGVILLNEYDLSMKALQLSVPVVGVLVDNSFNGTISTVNLDPWSTAKIAVEYFESKGLEKVSIISSFKPVFVTRGLAFSALWREKGHECELIIRYSDSNFNFEKNHGYLFTSDQYAQNYSEVFESETGHILSDKHIILGMDGKQLIDPSFYRFPSIAVNWKNIGEIAFNECLRRIKNPSSPAQNITLTGKALF